MTTGFDERVELPQRRGRLTGAVAALMLFGLVPSPAAAASLPAAAPACRTETFKQARYSVCRFDLKTADVRVFSSASDGTPYRTFDALSRDLPGRGLALTFAINGGMFQADWSPVGLLVEDGVERHPINRIAAPTGVRPVPNFYKQPNGVFFITRASGGAKAGIATTDAFVRTKPKAVFATQSGPMLVIDGKLHPAFIPGSDDRTRRSGVGVANDTTVVFAISDGAVNFDAFARLFRDQLDCRNALFLDGGTAPGIYAPDLGRNDAPGHGGYGPIIAVVRKSP